MTDNYCDYTTITPVAPVDWSDRHQAYMIPYHDGTGPCGISLHLTIESCDAELDRPVVSYDFEPEFYDTVAGEPMVVEVDAFMFTTLQHCESKAFSQPSYESLVNNNRIIIGRVPEY